MNSAQSSTPYKTTLCLCPLQGCRILAFLLRGVKEGSVFWVTVQHKSIFVGTLRRLVTNKYTTVFRTLHNRGTGVQCPVAISLMFGDVSLYYFVTPIMLLLESKRSASLDRPQNVTKGKMIQQSFYLLVKLPNLPCFVFVRFYSPIHMYT